MNYNTNAVKTNSRELSIFCYYNITGYLVFTLRTIQPISYDRVG